MRRSSVDEHFRLAEDQQAERKLRDAILLLDSTGIPYVVVGGWAVAAYGSRTPSVDLDVLIRSSDDEHLKTVVRNNRGIQLDAEAGAALLGLDLDFRDLRNALFGRPDLSYMPDDVLRDRVPTRTIETSGGPVSFCVPSAEALAFMKAKALRDRRLQWEASRDPAQLAALDQEDARLVRGKTTAYWERKAGKDIFDLAYLVSHHTPPARVRALLEGSAFGEEVRLGLRSIPEPLARFAVDMARRSRVRIPSPDRVLRELAAD